MSNWFEKREAFKTSNKDVIKWVRAYNGDDHFYISLKFQMQKRGYLTDKQIACVQRAIDSGLVVERPTYEVEKPTYPSGSRLVMNDKAARVVGFEANVSFPFRIVEVIKTHKETEKGLFLTFKPVSDANGEGHEITIWISRKVVQLIPLPKYVVRNVSA